ncbi:hypothetical protein E4U52_004528 [Claviceps spartinae]|nr:hypothetical protein E4U52_004528 [Claviceps spartinae]
MKYTAAIVALAATVIAIPTGGGDNSYSCNNDHPNYVCCQGGLLGGILCNINLLGNNCGGGSYCCKSAPQTGLINIGLECIKLL